MVVVVVVVVVMVVAVVVVVVLVVMVVVVVAVVVVVVVGVGVRVFLLLLLLDRPLIKPLDCVRGGDSTVTPSRGRSDRPPSGGVKKGGEARRRGGARRRCRGVQARTRTYAHTLRMQSTLRTSVTHTHAPHARTHALCTHPHVHTHARTELAPQTNKQTNNRGVEAGAQPEPSRVQACGDDAGRGHQTSNHHHELYPLRSTGLSQCAGGAAQELRNSGVLDVLDPEHIGRDKI